MTDPTKTLTKDPTIVTVLQHHDEKATSMNVALVRDQGWQLLTARQARDLAADLLDAADIAEKGEGFEVPPQMH